MKKGAPFFYRIEASEFFALTLQYSEKELGKFIKQLAIDLVTGKPNSSYAESLITETTEYINKKREAGRKGGKQKASSAKAVLKQKASTVLASNSNSNSNSTETKEKPKKQGSVVSLPEWLPGNLWDSYLEMRKRIKKPLEPVNYHLAFRKMEKLKSQGHKPAEVLEQSIFNSWQGLFEVRKDNADELREVFGV